MTLCSLFFTLLDSFMILLLCLLCIRDWFYWVINTSFVPMYWFSNEYNAIEHCFQEWVPPHDRNLNLLYVLWLFHANEELEWSVDPSGVLELFGSEIHSWCIGLSVWSTYRMSPKRSLMCIWTIWNPSVFISTKRIPRTRTTVNTVDLDPSNDEVLVYLIFLRINPLWVRFICMIRIIVLCVSIRLSSTTTTTLKSLDTSMYVSILSLSLLSIRWRVHCPFIWFLQNTPLRSSRVCLILVWDNWFLSMRISCEWSLLIQIQ